MAPPSDLGASNVPLTKDVVSQPSREAFPTFAEWASDGNVEQVNRSAQAAGELFVVPENFTLFITSAWVGAIESANATTHGFALLHSQTPDTSIKYILVGASVDHVQGQHGGNTNNSVSFPMPIRVEGGEKVLIQTGGFTTPVVSGGFTGFLLSKKISIRSV